MSIVVGSIIFTCIFAFMPEGQCLVEGRAYLRMMLIQKLDASNT